jgi:glycerol-3-phosphate O-acyltransferase / dihydroxyacetone phosphate acyltransferase
MQRDFSDTTLGTVFGSLLRRLVGAAVAVFYRLDRRGPGVPDGPVLLVANHPNSLLDPLILFRTAGRRSRPLARAPLFERAVLGRLLRAVDAIPVYRREDDPRQMARNRDALQEASDALRQGDAVQIFPEGRTHSDPALAPLRTGAARIVLASEAETGWSLGAVVVPVGLTYARKAVFRGHAVALYGDPIPVRPYRRAYEQDEQAAVRSLTTEIGRQLRALTLDLSRAEDEHLIDAAERVWALGKGHRTSRQRASLAERLPALQAFARGLAWLRAHDPDRHRRLAVRIRRYQRIIGVLGAGEGDLPDRYRPGLALRWVATRALPVALLAPLGLAAAVFWGIPYWLVGRTVGRLELPPEVVATYKVGAALVAYPLFLGLWTLLTAWRLGWTAALVVLVVLPVVGLVAVRWMDAARDVTQDLGLLLRLAGPGTRSARARRLVRTRLAAERRALTEEFDAIQALMRAGAPLQAPALGTGNRLS